MRVGYGIDDDNIDNDEDIGCTEFTTTWKIHLILFFKVWAKGQGLRVQETKTQNLHYCVLLQIISNQPAKFGVEGSSNEMFCKGLNVKVSLKT